MITVNNSEFKGVEKIIGKKILFSKTFQGDGSDFSAYNEACQFLKQKGYSLGSMERSEPIGLVKGEVLISKWRNLDKEDKENLDGVLFSASFRSYPVTVYLSINEEI